MSRTAALWAGWDRRAPRALGGPLSAPQGASIPGVPFMQNTLGSSARLIVEVAWGADLTASPDTWSWTDITADVLQADGARIDMSIGSGDEASTSQPAGCGMKLDNRAGLYSLGGQSPNWPNVRRNTPVRVRVDLGSGPETLFQGYANGFTPSWDSSGNRAIVTLSASGVLRRLKQGSKPEVSTLRRALTSLDLNDVLAYWPCEDGEDSTSFASALGDAPMTLNGAVSFAAYSSIPASQPLPTFTSASCTWYGLIPPYTSNGAVQVRLLMHCPTSEIPDLAHIMALHSSGTAGLWEVKYRTGGALSLEIWTRDNGTQLHDSGPISYDVIDKDILLSLEIQQSGADISWNLATLQIGETTGGVISATLAGNTIGQATEVRISPPPDEPPAPAVEGLTVGHVNVRNGVTSLFDLSDQLNAYTGEYVTDRLTRLCLENSIPIEIDGDSSVTMGPQTPITLLSLLRECETADQGFLYDGRSAGLTYVAHERRENAEASLTLDASAGDLAGPFLPIDDDQRNRNLVTATQVGGSSFTYEDEDGPLGTSQIGVYDHSVSFNVDNSSGLVNYAAWIVHLGTAEGYRYPRMLIDLAHSPHLANDWLLTRLSGRIDTTNIADVRTQLPAGTISSLLEGVNQSIDQFRWDVEAVCSSAQSWRVGVVAADTGDTGENVLRVDTDGSSLTAGVDVGSTSLSVTTPSGQLWTTAADDFPFDISLGGVQVTVTNITGSSNPQTFTVTGSMVTTAAPGGTPVSLWDPLVVGL